jgi:hypothetical protein
MYEQNDVPNTPSFGYDDVSSAPWCASWLCESDDKLLR